MISRSLETLAETIGRVQAKAKASGGWLVLTSAGGRPFSIASDTVKFHADAVEFIDDDGDHIILPYQQIALVEIAPVSG
jgi:hypothetical protein